jgi:hypothetical protein
MANRYSLPYPLKAVVTRVRKHLKNNTMGNGIGAPFV